MSVGDAPGAKLSAAIVCFCSNQIAKFLHAASRPLVGFL
jgi:hypothetical protein